MIINTLQLLIVEVCVFSFLYHFSQVLIKTELWFVFVVPVTFSEPKYRQTARLVGFKKGLDEPYLG